MGLLIPDKKKIEVCVIGITKPVAYPNGAFLLVLSEIKKDENSKRLPIIIGSAEAQAISISLDNMMTDRPLMHNLFYNFSSEFGINIREVHIYKLHNDTYCSSLVCCSGETTKYIDARTSDAVALSMHFGCPIYCNKDIIDKSGIIPEKEHTTELEEVNIKIFKDEKKGKANSFKKMTKTQLEDELQNALEQEEFERAALIRDEILNREPS